jgi:ubiquinone/menaquinone biosynthesis C-methylase UbiE
MYSWFGRNPASNRLVVELAKLGPEDRVLDVGCGAGAAVAAAAVLIGADRVAGVDRSPHMVDIAATRTPGADIRTSGAEGLDFADESFSVVWSIASYHHWVDRRQGLAECVRVAGPDGRIMIVEHLLKRSRGHGLDPSGARSVAGLLAELGCAETSVSEHKAGRAALIVVEGRIPARS